MQLDPELTLLATAAVAPTKLLIDYLSSSVYIPSKVKLGIGYLLAFALITLYQSYTGEIERAESVRRLISGDMLAAFSTLTGAVLVTQAQKLSDDKKAKRKREQQADE